MSEALPPVRRGGLSVLSNLSHTMKSQSEDTLSTIGPDLHPAGPRSEVTEETDCTPN